MNLRASIEQILNTTQYLAVAGPEVLGECRNVVLNFVRSRFHDKVHMLDAYRVMTKNVTLSYGLNYIDMREVTITF